MKNHNCEHKHENGMCIHNDGYKHPIHEHNDNQCHCGCDSCDGNNPCDCGCDSCHCNGTPAGHCCD